MVKKRTVVLYPNLGPRAGIGHIKRLLPFMYDSRFDSYIVHRDGEYLNKLIRQFNLDPLKVINLNNINTISQVIDMIILDNRESDSFLYDSLKDIAPIVGIDEGGEARKYIPYVVDVLPNLLETDPNYSNPGLLDLSGCYDKPVNGKLNNILVTFGGQDPFNLTQKVVGNLGRKYNITTVVGPLFKIKEFGVPKIANPENLKSIISNYDLVITSFGITAFEAISLNVPVALLNPTEYHEKLAKNAGFYIIDKKYHINYKKALKSIGKIELGSKENLVDFIYNLTISNNGCPVCGRKNNIIINRFIHKSYYHCNHCTIDYMLSHKKNMEYEDDYFFTDYKKQYGKTYLEDFDHIKTVGKSRLNFITKKVKEGALLDIGCAFGPFLKAVEECHLEPYGIDISEVAIKYITEELNLPGITSSFPLEKPLDFGREFSVVTMWYVIEHFEKLDKVLNQVNSHLKKGGVFAFSTPNSKGISGKRNYKEFLLNSPIDHFSLLSPKSAKKVLKEYGFKVYKINVTGHHPERFGKISKIKLFFNFFGWISHLLKLGDTFEVYAIKETNL